MEWFYVGATALLLGVQTSISPCPLATNIAAMSYVGRKVSSPRAVLGAGVLYTLGRVLAYIALGIVAVKLLNNIPGVSRFLERYMNLLIGPILILAAFFVVGIFSFTGPSATGSTRVQRLAAKSGVLAPLLLGIVFALTLCPVSAAFFFLSLVPLSIQYESSVYLPSVYGIGTGLPVVGFAIVLAFSAGSLGKVFNKLTEFELWARRITGAVFFLAGLYLIYRNFSGYLRLFS